MPKSRDTLCEACCCERSEQNQFHKIQVNNRQEMMHSSPVYVTMNMINLGVVQ